MALSEESKIKIKNAYRSGKLTPEQQDFINRAVQQKQITITEEDEIARQKTIKSTIPELQTIKRVIVLIFHFYKHF